MAMFRFFLSFNRIPLILVSLFGLFFNLFYNTNIMGVKENLQLAQKLHAYDKHGYVSKAWFYNTMTLVNCFIGIVLGLFHCMAMSSILFNAKYRVVSLLVHLLRIRHILIPMLLTLSEMTIFHNRDIRLTPLQSKCIQQIHAQMVPAFVYGVAAIMLYTTYDRYLMEIRLIFDYLTLSLRCTRGLSPLEEKTYICEAINLHACRETLVQEQRSKAEKDLKDMMHKEILRIKRERAERERSAEQRLQRVACTTNILPTLGRYIKTIFGLHKVSVDEDNIPPTIRTDMEQQKDNVRCCAAKTLCCTIQKHVKSKKSILPSCLQGISRGMVNLCDIKDKIYANKCGADQNCCKKVKVEKNKCNDLGLKKDEIGKCIAECKKKCDEKECGLKKEAAQDKCAKRIQCDEKNKKRWKQESEELDGLSIFNDLPRTNLAMSCEIKKTLDPDCQEVLRCQEVIVPPPLCADEGGKTFGGHLSPTKQSSPVGQPFGTVPNCNQMGMAQRMKPIYDCADSGLYSSRSSSCTTSTTGQSSCQTPEPVKYHKQMDGMCGSITSSKLTNVPCCCSSRCSDSSASTAVSQQETNSKSQQNTNQCNFSKLTNVPCCCTRKIQLKQDPWKRARSTSNDTCKVTDDAKTKANSSSRSTLSTMSSVKAIPVHQPKTINNTIYQGQNAGPFKPHTETKRLDACNRSPEKLAEGRCKNFTCLARKSNRDCDIGRDGFTHGRSSTQYRSRSMGPLPRREYDSMSPRPSSSDRATTSIDISCEMCNDTGLSRFKRALITGNRSKCCDTDRSRFSRSRSQVCARDRHLLPDDSSKGYIKEYLCKLRPGAYHEDTSNSSWSEEPSYHDSREYSKEYLCKNYPAGNTEKRPFQSWTGPSSGHNFKGNGNSCRSPSKDHGKRQACKLMGGSEETPNNSTQQEPPAKSLFDQQGPSTIRNQLATTGNNKLTETKRECFKKVTNIDDPSGKVIRKECDTVFEEILHSAAGPGETKTMREMTVEKNIIQEANKTISEESHNTREQIINYEIDGQLQPMKNPEDEFQNRKQRLDMMRNMDGGGPGRHVSEERHIVGNFRGVPDVTEVQSEARMSPSTGEHHSGGLKGGSQEATSVGNKNPECLNNHTPDNESPSNEQRIDASTTMERVQDLKLKVAERRKGLASKKAKHVTIKDPKDMPKKLEKIIKENVSSLKFEPNFMSLSNSPEPSDLYSKKSKKAGKHPLNLSSQTPASSSAKASPNLNEISDGIGQLMEMMSRARKSNSQPYQSQDSDINSVEAYKIGNLLGEEIGSNLHLSRIPKPIANPKYQNKQLPRVVKKIKSPPSNEPQNKRQKSASKSQKVDAQTKAQMLELLGRVS